MNAKERMAVTVRRRTPDRVPVMCQLALLWHYFLHAGLPPHRIWFTSEGFAEALLRLRARYGLDGILINIPGRDPAWRRDGLAVEPWGEGGERIRWRDGGETLIPPDDNPRHLPAPGTATRPAFEGFDPERDLERLDDWPLYTWGVYHTPRLRGKPPGLLREPPEYFLRTIDLARREAGGAFSIHGEVFSPFTHYLELFGYDQALLGLVTDPERAAATIEALCDAACVWGRAQARRGVDAVLISSAFAGAGFISPEMYRRFVLPCERRLVAAIRSQNPTPAVYTHTCGRLADRLELLAATGTGGIDTLDPPPLGDTDLEDAKARVGDRVFLKGNIDPAARRRQTGGALIGRLPGGQPQRSDQYMDDRLLETLVPQSAGATADHRMEFRYDANSSVLEHDSG